MKQRKTLVMLVGAVCLCLLCCCAGGGEERRVLEGIEQAWQLCEDSLPEAARRAEGLRGEALDGSEYVRQKYDLLTIRLRDKQYVVPSSPDSAVQAAEYFASRKDDRDKERAYYYAGSAFRDLRDYPRAVSYFLMAVDAAEQADEMDTLIWLNGLAQLRHLYMLQLNYEEELKVALKGLPRPIQRRGEPQRGEAGSKEASRESSLWQRNIGWYMMGVATAYRHLGDTLHCIVYCDSAYEAIRSEDFPARYGAVLAEMLATYSGYGLFDKADTLLAKLQRLPKGQRPQNYELTLARSYEDKGQADSAIQHYIIYYSGAELLSGRYEAAAGLQRCYLRRGDSRRAAEWGCLLYDTNDSIIAQRAFEQTQRAKNEYTYHRDREAEQAIRRRDERITFLSVTVGLALTSIIMGLAAFYLFRKKKFMELIIGKDRLLLSRKEEIRRRTEELEQRGNELMQREQELEQCNMELEQKRREIDGLAAQLGEAERTIAESQIRFEHVLRDLEQRTMVNKELTRIALKSDATIKAEDIVDYFNLVAEGRAVLRPSAWKELMTAVETICPGFIEAVEVRMHGQVREPLLRTICLLKIGQKPGQIAKVMDAKIQTVWNRVKRAEEVCGELLLYRR